MSSQSVTILTPNARRQTLKLTPNTTLLEILEQVCRKFQLDPNRHILRHHNKTVDLSGMFRFSGLPNNCLLEMEETENVRKEAEVHIVLQTESGNRLAGDFSPATNLQAVLLNLCPQSAENDNWVVIYMRKEVHGTDLSTTTLKKLGLTSGRAMLRVLQRNPEELRVQANVSAVLLPKSIPPAVAGVAKTDKLVENVGKVEEQREQQPMEVDPEEAPQQSTSKDVQQDSPEVKKPKFEVEQTAPMEESSLKVEKAEALSAEEMQRLDSEIRIVGENDAVIFSLESTQRVQERDLPDSFFDLTIADVRLLLRDLKDQAKSLDDAPLLTAQLRDMERDRKTLKLLQYKKTVLRIHFPDRHVLQATFNPIDTIECVTNLVRKHLADPQMAFHLFTTPPKQILSPNSRLVELQCVPQAVIHFGVDDNAKSETGSFLCGDLLKNLTSPDAAILVALRSRGLSLSNVLGVKQEDDEEMSGASGNAAQKPRIPDNFQRSSTTASPSTSNVPKWFKMAK